MRGNFVYHLYFNIAIHKYHEGMCTSEYDVWMFINDCSRDRLLLTEAWICLDGSYETEY